MPYPISSLFRRVRLRLGALALGGLAVACGGSNQLGPSSGGGVGAGDSLAVPVDSTTVPIDSPLVGPAAPTPQNPLAGPGIPFGPNNMRAVYMTPMYNGTQVGIEPAYLMAELQTARAKGGRFVLKMAGKRDTDIQNANGTFSLAKWKVLVNRYRGLDFSSYINDGTLMGHFLIDEPEFARKWGGTPISQTTVEEMARYSKQLWPSMTTFARGVPSWLAKAPITYTYLDAGWLQDYTFNRDVPTWVPAEAAAARLKGLGLVVGLNILDGGNGSSGVPGGRPGKWAMSASEIRSVGTVLLNEPRACAFFTYTYLYQGAAYFARPDIHSALVDLWNKAKAHAPTSCRQ